MAEDPIPADVHEFIVTNIDSIAYLEALLLLRADRAMAWTAAAVAARLYIPEAEAGSILSRLADNRFAASERGAFRYDCDADGDLMVGRLSEIYSRHLIPVTNLIHSRPGRIRAFASAFKLRKDS
jgi:hypothetical protein